MIEVIIISLIATAVLIYELPPLIKERMWRETAAFLILLSLGVFLAITQALDISTPNPVDAIKFVFTPISDWVDKMLS